MANGRNDRADKWFGFAETSLYAVVAVALVVGAAVVLVDTARSFVEHLDDDVPEAAIELLSELLLVFVFVELLSAVRVTMRERQLMAEPFLLVGIIAAIKEIVVVAGAERPADEGFEVFRNSMVEIGVLALVILVLAIAALPAPQAGSGAGRSQFFLNLRNCAGAERRGLADEVFDDPERFGTTYAALIVQHGEIVAERYGNELPHLDGSPGTPVDADTGLLSWSIAKSVTHAAIGLLVADGDLELDKPLRVPEWSDIDDPRRAITLEDFLTMRDGLDFVEEYVDGKGSNVIDMLFGAGQDDVAHYAAERPLKHEPGTVYNYSSGTSNIVARTIGYYTGDVERFLRERVFEPIGMHSAQPKFDDAGTFIGSSYVYATRVTGSSSRSVTSTTVWLTESRCCPRVGPSTAPGPVRSTPTTVASTVRTGGDSVTTSGRFTRAATPGSGSWCARPAT